MEVVPPENCSQHIGKPHNRNSTSLLSSSSAVHEKALEHSKSSRPAQSESEARDHHATSASAPAWHAAALLTQLHVHRAEYLWDCYNSDAAKSCLQAARDACQRHVSAEVSDAYPLQSAAILYQEVLLELRELASVNCALLTTVSYQGGETWCRVSGMTELLPAFCRQCIALWTMLHWLQLQP